MEENSIKEVKMSAYLIKSYKSIVIVITDNPARVESVVKKEIGLEQGVGKDYLFIQSLNEMKECIIEIPGDKYNLHHLR